MDTQPNSQSSEPGGESSSEPNNSNSSTDPNGQPNTESVVENAKTAVLNDASELINPDTTDLSFLSNEKPEKKPDQPIADTKPAYTPEIKQQSTLEGQVNSRVSLIQSAINSGYSEDKISEMIDDLPGYLKSHVEEKVFSQNNQQANAISATDIAKIVQDSLKAYSAERDGKDQHKSENKAFRSALAIAPENLRGNFLKNSMELRKSNPTMPVKQLIEFAQLKSGIDPKQAKANAATTAKANAALTTGNSTPVTKSKELGDNEFIAYAKEKASSGKLTAAEHTRYGNIMAKKGE